MTKDYYIGQRAATAIISEAGSYQISSDALQSINQFLDEVLMTLIQRTQSLDLSVVKSHVLNLLPRSLGKNAIVEAELEVKTYSETNAIDYPLYERLKTLDPCLPLEQVWKALRYACIDYCTLADKSQGVTPVTTTIKPDLSISPMVTIYLTTILEHMAEYILTTVAVAAEQEHAEYIRIKEVYSALLDDPQVGTLFHHSDIRTKLEKRILTYPPQHHQLYQTILPTPAPSPAVSYKNQQMSPSPTTAPPQHDPYDSNSSEPYLDDPHDDLDAESYSETPPSAQSRTSFSNLPSTNNVYRPVSVLSNGTTATTRSNGSSKKGFRLFGRKDKRTSSSIDITNRAKSPVPNTVSNISSQSSSSVQMYNPDAPALDFEELIRSGNTMKVSLTPNRLRSIEVKSHNDLSRTPSSASLPTNNISPNNNLRPARAKSPPPLHHSLPHYSHGQPHHHQQKPTMVPFENPRAAPKPPVSDHQLPPPLPPPTTHPGNAQQHKPPLSPVITSPSQKQQQQTPPLTPSSSVASRLSKSTLARPPNHDATEPPQSPPADAHSHDKRQPPPLVLKARSSPYNTTTDDDDVDVADLPSPPNTSEPPIVPQRYNRPSSMVAKRASTSSRPTSFHESFALTMERASLGDQYRPSTPPVAPSASGTAEPISYPVVTPPLLRSASDRPMVRSTRITKHEVITEDERESFDDDDLPSKDSNLDLTSQSSVGSAVEDRQSEHEQKKIAPQLPSSTPDDLTITTTTERSSSLPDKDNGSATSLVSPIQTAYDRRDRLQLLLQKKRDQLQQQKPTMVDSSMQTDPIPGIPSLATLLRLPTLTVTDELATTTSHIPTHDHDQASAASDGLDHPSSGSEQGVVEGDEEWFMQEDDWEDLQEQDSMMAEWLLGEA